MRADLLGGAGVRRESTCCGVNEQVDGEQTSHWTDNLRRLGACREAIEWARSYPNLRTAWAACERKDWIVWLLDVTDGWPPGTVWMDCVLEKAAVIRRLVPEPPEIGRRG